MIVRPKARELIVGVADDPTFGPVIVFGQGGTAVEVIDDKALALPPLDLDLAATPDRAHARFPHPQGVSQRAGRRRERDRAAAGQARAAGGGFSRDARDRSQSGPRRRDRRDRGRCAGLDGAGRSGATRRLRPSAFRDPALSDGMGAAHAIARRHGDSRPSGSPGGRAALSGPSLPP